MGSLPPNDPSMPRQKLTPKHIADLRGLTPAPILTPGDDNFPATLNRWSMAASRPAGATLTPRSPADIAAILPYVAEHHLDLAVKGGGHSTAGASSTSGGLLIDLSAYLNTVHVDAAAKTITAGGGAIWGDVDRASTAHGLATVGGTVSDTGVGGLTLGGGYGWLSGEHGLAVDNLISMTVVLASGEVRTVTEKDTDLWFALRGAGQNFGVVTEFVYRAWEQGKMYAGMLMFPPTPAVVAKVVDAVNEVYTPGVSLDGRTKLGGKGMGGLGIARPPIPAELGGGGPLLLAPVLYNGTEAEAKVAYKSLFDAGPVVNTCAEVEYPVANMLLNPPPIPGMRSSMKGASYTWPIRAGFVEDMVATFTRFTDEVADARPSLMLWEAYDAAVTVRVPNTAMAFCNRGYQGNGMVAPIWTEEGLDGRCRQWARDCAEMFKEELKRTGKEGQVKGDGGAVMLYGNYDQYDEKSRDIFGANYERLQGLKRRFDPSGVFDKLFPIVPAEEA